MSALLAPLAPIANILFPSSDRTTGLSDQPDTASSAPTVSTGEVLGKSLLGTGTQEVPSQIATTVPNPKALGEPTRVTGSQDMTMQTVSTQTDNNNQLQSAIVTTATTAGLYGSLPGKGSPNRRLVTTKPKHSTLATHYLCTAEARDLPSYPTAGLSHPETAGAAAALLAHSSHKPVGIWRPDPISAAGAAASLAQANTKRVDNWKSAPDNPVGNAALHALGDPSFLQLYRMSDAPKRWSLTGAIGAMQSSKQRRRSESSPMPLTTQQETKVSNSALTAATLAHMPSARRLSIATEGPTSEGLAERKLVDAGRVPQQDKRASDILRAATISMSRSNRDTTLPPDTPRQKHLVQPDLQRLTATPPSRRYNSNIEEAARKVAAERLAKIGYDTGRPRSTSLPGTQGAQASVNRSYSGVGAGSSNLGRAHKINANMALPQDNLAKIDAKKRGENAVLLMSTAQRNVQARMSGIDKQVAESRGVIRREDWDAKAIQVAQAGSDRRLKHHGKISIGGGAYMAPEEIEAIAERNVRPVLDEMDRKADAERAGIEAERAKDLEMQLDIEETKRVQNLQRTRERETHEDIKRAKGLGLREKCLEAVEKEEERRRKEEGKRTMKERKNLAKTESKRGRESMGAGNAEDFRGPTSPTSPMTDSGEREGGIRGFINRFRRRHSRQISRDEKSTIVNSVRTNDIPIVPTFSGGHRATLTEQQQQHPTKANDNARVASASPRPPPVSRIPRPVSAIVVPPTNGTLRSSRTLVSPGSIRAAAVVAAPPVVAGGNVNTAVKRRHSLPSVGSAAYRLRGRKRGGDMVLPSWSEEQGAKKGKGKANSKATKDFSKINGRISSYENHPEYPDEARDKFSQQPTNPNRPSSGYFPQGERRFSAGETSMSSRFHENL